VYIVAFVAFVLKRVMSLNKEIPGKTKTRLPRFIFFFKAFALLFFPEQEKRHLNRLRFLY
jgi:hypothetical protein